MVFGLLKQKLGSAMKYSWSVEKEEAFHALYSLIYNSELKWTADDVRRRIVIPLFLGQLLSFYDDKGILKGFLTVAFMNDFAASHQPTIGILPTDWRSGKDFWVVDLVAPNGDGDKMLRTVMRDLKDAEIGAVHYFRLKYNEVRETSL